MTLHVPYGHVSPADVSKRDPSVTWLPVPQPGTMSTVDVVIYTMESLQTPIALPPDMAVAVFAVLEVADKRVGLFLHRLTRMPAAPTDRVVALPRKGGSSLNDPAGAEDDYPPNRVITYELYPGDGLRHVLDLTVTDDPHHTRGHYVGWRASAQDVEPRL